MPPSPPYSAGAAASSAPEAVAPREPPPGTRRAQAAVSGGDSIGRHSGAISGRTWVARPNQWRRRRGGRTESAAGLLQSTPPSRSGDRQSAENRLCDFWRAPSGATAFLPGRWSRAGDRETASWCPPAPPPRQPAPPGPEDAEIDVEFSQTSQKEMYLPGHGPRRWVTDSVLGTGRRGWERGGCLLKWRGRGRGPA